MRRLLISLVMMASGTLGASGCAHSRADLFHVNWAPHTDRVVFAADGAGNFQVSSRMLRHTALADGLPVDIMTYEWSHGYMRIFADQTDYRWAVDQGEKLADIIMEFHARHPHTKIYLWGHSAGAAVVLRALEIVSPDVVEGMVLLAPSVSAFYDLRPALCRVACHIDVFHSRGDWWYLGLGTRIIGTSEGSHRVAAGRFGFKPLIHGEDDACLYSKLRQHPWHRSDRSLGHTGGHYGGYQPDFLRAYIMPLFFEQRGLPEK